MRALFGLLACTINTISLSLSLCLKVFLLLLTRIYAFVVLFSSSLKMAASSPSPSPKMIKLVSKDWKEFIVEESVAKVSGFIKESIEHGSTIITLDKTKAEVLEKVIKYCEKHAQDEYRKNWIPNLANLNLETLIGLFQVIH